MFATQTHRKLKVESSIETWQRQGTIGFTMLTLLTSSSRRNRYQFSTNQCMIKSAVNSDIVADVGRNL